MFKIFNAPTLVNKELDYTKLRVISVNLHNVLYSEDSTESGFIVLYLVGGSPVAVQGCVHEVKI